MKIIATLLLMALVFCGYSQTFTTKKTGKDTLLIRTQTVIDTLVRKDMVRYLDDLESQKKRKQAELDYINSEIDRIKLLKKKTD